MTIATHVLLWDGRAHTLEVLSIEEMLARNRGAYTDDLFPCPVPVMAGSSADMHSAMQSCSNTMLVRQQATRKARAAIRRAMYPATAHPRKP